MAGRSSLATLDIPQVSWRELEPDFMRAWSQGQHLSLIGPSGTGKTTFAEHIIEQRIRMRKAMAAVLANKRRDEMLTRLVNNGWPRRLAWPPYYEDRQKHKVIIWPTYGLASTSVRKNANVFREALDRMVDEGGWTVYFDETRYFVQTLGLRNIVDELWNGARSGRLTMIAGSQGTTWINKTMVEQPTWIVAFQPRGEEAADDLAKLMGNRELKTRLLDLPSHSFIIGELPSRRFYVSKLEMKGKG